MRAAHGNASHASMLFWATAIANLASDLVVGRFTKTRIQERLSFPLALLMAVPLTLFMLDPGPIAATVLCFTVGLGVAYLLGLQRRFLQAVPETNRGQAFGLVFTGLSTLQGVTMVLAGAAADVWAPTTVIAIFGAATILCALTLAKHLRPSEPPQSPSTALGRELP